MWRDHKFADQRLGEIEKNIFKNHEMEIAFRRLEWETSAASDKKYF